MAHSNSLVLSFRVARSMTMVLSRMMARSCSLALSVPLAHSIFSVLSCRLARSELMALSRRLARFNFSGTLSESGSLQVFGALCHSGSLRSFGTLSNVGYQLQIRRSGSLILSKHLAHSTLLALSGSLVTNSKCGGRIKSVCPPCSIIHGFGGLVLKCATYITWCRCDRNIFTA